jgi:hypothetical protein
MSQAVAQPVVRWRLGARARKGVLVVHIASAGAWLGIDVVMGVLVLTALLSDEDRTKALAFRALELVLTGLVLVALPRRWPTRPLGPASSTPASRCRWGWAT